MKYVINAGNLSFFNGIFDSGLFEFFGGKIQINIFSLNIINGINPSLRFFNLTNSQIFFKNQLTSTQNNLSTTQHFFINKLNK